MIIYVHKVRMNPMDGWGNNMGIHIEILGRYTDMQKCLEDKNQRDNTKNATYCDIGKSWVEKEFINTDRNEMGILPGND